MAIVETPKSASANSYVSLAEATAYFTQRLHAEAWSSHATLQEAALVTACRRLDEESFVGQQTTTTQALKWPREGVENPDTGEDYDADTIPTIIKNAQCELALSLLNADDDALADSGLEPYSQVTVGPLTVVLRDNMASGALPATVERLLASVLLSSAGTYRLARG